MHVCICYCLVMFVCNYVRMYVRIYVCMSVCMHVCMYWAWGLGPSAGPAGRRPNREGNCTEMVSGMGGEGGKHRLDGNTHWEEEKEE